MESSGIYYKKRILVIEEETALRLFFKILLLKMKYGVTVTDSGENGLECFQKKSYDLVLSDLTMSGMDGWTLARHIKEVSPCTPVILMTGWSREMIKPHFKESRADLVIFKPMGFYEIKNVLNWFLG
ncbi:response regulator [Desulfococcaceae bacterium HSG8]|nr:response regulator [Desulfococcaceae bacterium HSG8]